MVGYADEQLDWLHQQHEEQRRQTKLLDEIATSSARTQQYVGLLLVLALLTAVAAGLLGIVAAFA